MKNITGVPQTADYIGRVINLRGQVIPIVDLGPRFCMPEIDHTDRTCNIVLEIPHDTRTMFTGLVVDTVSLGMPKIRSGVKTLLDADRAITNEALSEPKQAA